MCACFCLETGLNKFFHTSAQMGISCIKCVLEEFWKTNSRNTQLTLFVTYFKYLSLIKLITKYCIWIFCIQFSVAMETVNPIIWCSSRLQKVNIQLEYFVFSNRKHLNYLCTIYKKFQEKKTSYLLEKLFEKDLVHFVSDSIFKRLKFDYSS